jgi:hypothetical protein
VFAFGAMDQVTGAALGRITEGVIARRLLDAAAPGRHVWVVGLAFLVTDPQQALDDMQLGAQNLVGTYGMHCLACGRQYPASGGLLISACPGQVSGRLTRPPG